MNSSFTRDQLYYRHQLSHQQVDDWLGEKKSLQFPESKARHLGLLNEFLVIARLFTESGIGFIPQKGPLLSYRIYQDPLYRSYNDLDFLVSTESVGKAIDVLSQNGYTVWVYYFPVDPCRQRILFKNINEFALYNPEKDITVEIHWALFTGSPENDRSLKQLIDSNQVKIEFMGQKFDAFSVELELLHLIFHGGLHGWENLKWLVDIKDLLQRNEINQSVFQKLTGRLQAHRMVAVCNELLKTFFPGTPLLPSSGPAPQHLVNFALQQIYRKKQDDKKSVVEYLRAFWHMLGSFPGFRFKFNTLKSMLFASDLIAVKWLPCCSLTYYIVGPFWKLFRGFR